MPAAPALSPADTERIVEPCPACDTTEDVRCAACNSRGWMVVRPARALAVAS